MKSELYFSCDIECDGPVPYPYSMSSIGFCVAGYKTEGVGLDRYNTFDPTKHVAYYQLKPISEHFVPEAAAVSGLKREDLIEKGAIPSHAMNKLGSWVRDTAAQYDARPVFVAYPLSFDWMWSHWYFETHSSKGDPFGFSNAIDIKTLYMVYSGNLLTRSTKRHIPDMLKGERLHTHNALEDAQGQADLFSNIMVALDRNSPQ